MKSNRVEKNNKTTIAAILIFAFILMIIGSEYILSGVEKNKTRLVSETRYIRLRENPPETVYLLTPHANKLEFIPDSERDELAHKFSNMDIRLKINKDGYIFPSQIHADPDLTLLFLGGSTTECRLVPENSRFPFVVGASLETGGRKVNSINAAMSGNHSLDSINILINKGINARPDVAIFMHNINDLVLLVKSDYWATTVKNPILVTEKVNIAHEIKLILKKVFPHLYLRLYHFYNRLRVQNNSRESHPSKPRPEVDAQALHRMKYFENNLEIFITICRSYKIVPVLMTQASRLTSENGETNPFTDIIEKRSGFSYLVFHRLYQEMNQIIRSVADKNNVLLIDLAELIPPTKDYLYDTVHYNEKGGGLCWPLALSLIS